MSTYKTFLRSATNFAELGSARKITVDTGLTEEHALARCNQYNNNRTPRQIKRGTKLEFTKE